MSYSELAWTSIPETLEDHMAQYCDRTHEMFDFCVDVARYVIDELNDGKLVNEKFWLLGTDTSLGEILLKWDLNKFLNENPPLFEGNLTIHEI
jgi:hypothetical protein